MNPFTIKCVKNTIPPNHNCSQLTWLVLDIADFCCLGFHSRHGAQKCACNTFVCWVNGWVIACTDPWLLQGVRENVSSKRNMQGSSWPWIKKSISHGPTNIGYFLRVILFGVGFPAGNESKFVNFHIKRGDEHLQNTHFCAAKDFDSHLALNSMALHENIMAS